MYSENGIDIQQLLDYRRSNNNSILGFPGSTTLQDRMSALELECDILIPAALENQITIDNVHRINAKIIGEAANGPITAEAEEVLASKGILVVPDMFLNAGESLYHISNGSRTCRT
ncbi:MAG: hypothetical protein U0T81_02315 [Saprospiraceae bacterium]